MNSKVREIKSKLRLDINRTLLGICFTLFGLIVAIKPSLLQESVFLPTQMTMAIPFLLASIFARSRLSLTRKPHMWEEYGFVTFLIGYSFLINVIGILLTLSIRREIGLVFFCVNIALALLYSTFECIEDPKKFTSRVKKDIFFILLVLLGGIFPALGVF